MNPLGLTCSVALSDFGLKGTGTIMGFNAGMLSEPLRLAVPQKNPNYVFTKESLSIMATWWEVGAREPLFITGPHGSGKTSFVQQFCARVGAPLISITARSRLDRTDLIGHYVIDRDKSMRFVDGPLTRAWRHGFVFLVNEMSASPADLWLSVNELLEGSPLYIEATDETVPMHPNCRIILTDNIRGLTSDDQDRYLGRHIQDAAVMDRCWKMRMDYMSRECEEKLLRETTPLLPVQGIQPEKWNCELAKRLRRAAEKVRRAYSGDDGSFIEANLSTRSLLRFRDLLIMSYRSPGIQDRDALTRAMRIALTESVDPASALAIEKLVEAELGDIGKHLIPA